jgi:hypothetical protein
MALGVDRMTPVPYPIAYALIDGLSADSLVKHPEALTIFPEVKLIDFAAATEDALARTHPAHIERVWEDGKQEPKTIKHEGCFVDHREVAVRVGPENVLETLLRLCEQQSWPVEIREAEQQVIATVQNQIAGRNWIEWRISHAESVTSITQTVFFSPRGLPGFLYWYLLRPFHLMDFRGLIMSIRRQSEAQ